VPADGFLSGFKIRMAPIMIWVKMAYNIFSGSIPKADEFFLSLKQHEDT